MDAETFCENLKSNFTCAICSGYFIEPVTIQCGHSFCKVCLLSFWNETFTPQKCPTCKAIIPFGYFLCNRRLQNLSIIGKMLRPHLLQSMRALTICEKHGKEETLFCEEDQRPLCGPCFLSTEHKEHKVLLLEKAAGQCMEKLQEKWNILKGEKQKFQMELEGEEIRQIHSEVHGETLKVLILSEYEKMHLFFLEEERLQLQRLVKESRDNLANRESKDSQTQEVLNQPMTSEQQSVEMLKLDDLAVIKLFKSEFEKKHQVLSKEKQLHLQKLEKQVKDNLAKFEESRARMTQHINNLQMVMSEIDKNFEKLPTEILQGMKGTLERNEELLLQNPVVASPRWTMYPIIGMKEMLLTFHRDIFLDPETANPHLILSDDLKSVKYDSVPQAVPDNPKRFEFSPCVLATQSFSSGKHYWEVEVENKTEWEVGICKESIRRKGLVCKGCLWEFWGGVLSSFAVSLEVAFLIFKEPFEFLGTTPTWHTTWHLLAHYLTHPVLMDSNCLAPLLACLAPMDSNYLATCLVRLEPTDSNLLVPWHTQNQERESRNRRILQQK
ncbi:probable E3 ubiquitin-protein ligase TRIML1 [Dromiciops gliroides]|uniref:probable E3 ubiquitin-protein ligase TRIML1 n=1 Tax=Dromiciops gliroides TaxID=33562 RepID=UPI001CC64E81|nr:probable E3 ubiquitin-protein ligase TRIML1 [Dromiciops gliroides]